MDYGIPVPRNRICATSTDIRKKRAVEVYQLLDVFLLLGVLAILQSDNGSEFTAQVITELIEL
jgi:hypothetical protein